MLFEKRKKIEFFQRGWSTVFGPKYEFFHDLFFVKISLEIYFN